MKKLLGFVWLLLLGASGLAAGPLLRAPLPAGWQEVAAAQPPPGMPALPTQQFTPTDERNAAVLVTVLGRGDGRVTDLPGLRALHRQLCQPMLAASSAPYAAKELTLPRGHAYYATFEDPNLVGKPPIRGDYKFSTSCVILFEGGVLANATVFTDEASGATFQEALQIVEKLELAPAPAAPTAVLVNGHITLALSTLDTALVLPTGFTLDPDASAHFLAQGPDGLIISGWIEPKEQYPGFRALWQRDRQRMTAGGRLALQGEKFETIAGWDAVFYTIRLAADATQLNLRACCTRGNAWFDVHLSCTGKAPRLEALRAVLRELTWQPQAKR